MVETSNKSYHCWHCAKRNEIIECPSETIARLTRRIGPSLFVNARDLLEAATQAIYEGTAGDVTQEASRRIARDILVAVGFESTP